MTTTTKQSILIVAEMRRYQFTSYKNDTTTFFGLNPEDKVTIDNYLKTKNNAYPPKVDPEDGRFIVRGPGCNFMELINILNVERGKGNKHSGC